MRIHTSSRRGKKHAHFLLSALTNVLILGRLLRLLLCFVPCAKPHRLGAVRTTTTCHHILYRCRWSCGQNSWHGGWSFPQPFPSWIKHLKEGSCLGTVVDQAILKDQDVAVDVLFWQTKIGETQLGAFFSKSKLPMTWSLWSLLICNICHEIRDRWRLLHGGGAWRCRSRFRCGTLNLEPTKGTFFDLIGKFHQGENKSTQHRKFSGGIFSTYPTANGTGRRHPISPTKVVAYMIRESLYCAAWWNIALSRPELYIY